ncbi:deuterolysin M35 metalloprotease [Pterulicium gracile]|uniref:Deuterolysin M35 metalloprotease n=1 Tax=Pterulicium gracile TaxID=1884261 RepID=A0A5C3QEF1_9AGAR|nr:deuterolysin M35 metalloprotease [Pterula gracilis]
MFPRTSLLAAALAFAATAAASPGLSFSVSAPKSIEGVANLKLSSVLENTGDEVIRVLNDPQTPLSKLPTKSFTVTGSAGGHPSFRGAHAKYDPEIAAAKGAYTTIQPGESVRLNHDLSTLFDFTDAGEDDYDFIPNKPFTLVKEDGTLEHITADLPSRPTAKITGNLAAREVPTKRNKMRIEKRADFPGCSSSEESDLVTAYGAATSMANEASSSISSASSGDARYEEWFGAYSSSNQGTASGILSKVAGGDWTGFSYDCSCTEAGTYAYVYPARYGEIFLCGVFWDIAVSGPNSRAGTLIHESSHFTQNGGTDDIVYGTSGARDLASSSPSQAINNADNYEYYAEHP